jgi:hypothetical protein
MKKVQTTLIALSVGSVLAGSAVDVFAGNAKSYNQPFEGIVVEDVVVVEQLPTEVQHGSTKVGDVSEQSMADMVKLAAPDAINIATKAVPGKVTELQLDEENGYLIWEVTELSANGQETQLKIDAGNGRLLAAEVGEQKEDKNDNDHEDRNEGKHSSWKFWEDNDRDEKGSDRN